MATICYAKGSGYNGVYKGRGFNPSSELGAYKPSCEEKWLYRVINIKDMTTNGTMNGSG